MQVKMLKSADLSDLEKSVNTWLTAQAVKIEIKNTQFTISEDRNVETHKIYAVAIWYYDVPSH